MRTISSSMWPTSLNTGSTTVTCGGGWTISRSVAVSRRRNVMGASDELTYARIRPSAFRSVLRDGPVDRVGNHERVEALRTDQRRRRTEDEPASDRRAIHRRRHDRGAREAAGRRHVTGRPPALGAAAALDVPVAVAAAPHRAVRATVS